MIYDDHFIQNEVDKIKLLFINDVYPDLVKETPELSGAARKGWGVVADDAELPRPIINSYDVFNMHFYALINNLPDYSGWHEYPEMLGSDPYIAPVPKGIENLEHIIIGNRVRYVFDLNNGFSDQQDAFYIEKIVERAVERVNEGRIDE